MAGEAGNTRGSARAPVHSETLMDARTSTEKELIAAREALERANAELEQSREWFRVTLSSIGDAVISADTDGRISFVNPVAEAMTGWPSVQAVGAPLEQVFQVIDEDTGQLAESPLRKVLRAGEVAPITHPTVLIARNGARHAIEQTAAPIRARDGEIVGAVIVFRDVTARRQAEASLRDTAEHLILALEAGNLGDWQWDAHSDLVMLSDRAADMFDLPRGKPVRRALVPSLLGASDETQARVPLEEALARQSDYEAEYRVRRHDGSTRWIAVRGRGLYADDGSLVGMIGVVQDITARKRSEERLRELYEAAQREIRQREQAEAALREMDRRKDEFLATLAHELRNPLAPIRHAALISKLPTATEAQKRWSHDVINRQVQHMSLLLDDLLDISRITRGTLELRMELTDLASIIDTAVETARPSIDAKRHKLSVEVPSEPVQIAADPLRLSQVLSNLLTNAAKYTDPEGEIRVRAHCTPTEVIIRVADNGIGIAPDALPSIFEMFSQLHTGRDRSEGGLGIGLALSRGLVALHGGTIEAHSGGPGLGSEFSVRLPRRRLHSATSETPCEAASAPTTRRRILVADDNPDGAESLAILLRVEGHEVSVVNDGAAALAAFDQLQPDVALLDIGMPGLNGYEVAQRVRQKPHGRSVLLIAITGWGQDSDKARALAAGFDHHFTKPVEPDRITALLRR